MSKGSAPKAPEESQHSKELAAIANERYSDYERMYQPLEKQYANVVASLDSDTAYRGATAKAQQAIGANAGNAMMSAAARMAAGGSSGMMNNAYDAAANSGTFIMDAYGAQSANYLRQATALAKLGNGIVDQNLGAYSSIADVDTTRINSNFANKVGYDIAKQNALNTGLASLAKFGFMYGAHNGWFGGPGSVVDGGAHGDSFTTPTALSSAGVIPGSTGSTGSMGGSSGRYKTVKLEQG